MLAIVSPTLAHSETQPLAATNYTVPSTAIYVAEHGDNSATGSLETPLKSISEAIRRVDVGGTIVIREGTYREKLPTVSKTLTMQSYPGEEVWIKGSMVVSDWSENQSGWVHEGWVKDFCETCADPRLIDARYPAAHLPDQVFLDGVPQGQVTTIADVQPGKFYVDRAQNRLVLGSDPTGRYVEVSVFDEALVLVRGAERSVVRGLGFGQFSPTAKDGYSGMVKADASAVTFEGNTFAHSAAVGLNVYAAGAHVHGNLFLANGLTGLGAWRADDLILRDNRFINNNSENFVTKGIVAAAAGAKITTSKNISVIDNHFDHNFANGLWLDLSVSNATIRRNTTEHNSGNGMFIEISAHVRVEMNFVCENKSAGIAVSESSDVWVDNNVLTANSIGFSVTDGSRTNPDTEEHAQGITWITQGIRFTNNSVWLRNASQMAIRARDYEGLANSRDMLTQVSQNKYLRIHAQEKQVFAEIWRGTQRQLFFELKGLQTDLDWGAGSMEAVSPDQFEPITDCRQTH